MTVMELLHAARPIYWVALVGTLLLLASILTAA